MAPLRVLMSGQSNAIGRNGGGTVRNAIDSRVKVWNNVNPLGINGTAFGPVLFGQVPFDTTANEYRQNIGAWFCHAAAQALQDEVRYVLVAQGGTPISEWVTSDDGSAPMAAEIEAVWAATGQDPAQVFLWHQGEGDSGGSASTYKTRFLELVSRLKANGIIAPDCLIVIGGISPSTTVRANFNANALHALAAENGNFFYADPTGLATSDGTHFLGPDLRKFGYRYWDAVREQLLEEGPTMADLYALVNEGGTPGEEGTGVNKIANITKLMEIGLGSVNVTEPDTWDGSLPGESLLTGLMLAAGAIVKHGSNANGHFYRWKNGLQLCFGAVPVPYSAATILQGTWTYPAGFIAAPIVLVSPQSTANVTPSETEWSPLLSSSPGSTSTIIRMRRISGGTSFGTGDVLSAGAVALGRWK